MRGAHSARFSVCSCSWVPVRAQMPDGEVQSRASRGGSGANSREWSSSVTLPLLGWVSSSLPAGVHKRVANRLLQLFACVSRGGMKMDNLGAHNAPSLRADNSVLALIAPANCDAMPVHPAHIQQCALPFAGLGCWLDFRQVQRAGRETAGGECRRPCMSPAANSWAFERLRVIRYTHPKAQIYC